MKILKLTTIFFCLCMHLGVSASLPDEETLQINASVQKAMANEYDEDVLLVLETGAEKGHPECLLHYGEYLLHQESDLEKAFDCLDAAAEGGITEAHTLIASVIENWEDSKEVRKALFIEKWPDVYQSNMLVINPPEYTPDTIAEFFLKKNHQEAEKDITPLKLQKMVYYAQACSLQAYKKPIFEEKVESWTYGPVIRSIYNDYKEFESNIIQLRRHDLERSFNFDVDTLNLLEAVYTVCIEYSASVLWKMTHAPESPWSQVYEERMNKAIPFLLMMRDKTRPVLEVMSVLKGEDEYDNTPKRRKVQSTQTDE